MPIFHIIFRRFISVDLFLTLMSVTRIASAKDRLGTNTKEGYSKTYLAKPRDLIIIPSPRKVLSSPSQAFIAA